jgi:predicted secreted protein
VEVNTDKTYAVIMLWSVIVSGLTIPAAVAGETEQYNIVSIQAQRSMEVDNDLMTATLASEIEGKDPALLGDKINSSMAWALKEAGNSQEVDVMTGNYHVHAVYDENSIDHWRASQTLTLTSRNVAGMTRLIGVLQKRLLVKSMGFSVSDQKKDDTENELIDAALDAFKNRADIVVDNLGAAGYRIVRIAIESPDSMSPPRPLIRSTVMESKLTAPAVEAGMSKISIIISGSIELQ